MAKNESTAVNELIELMSNRPAPDAPGQDLMFQPPKPSPQVQPPRRSNPARMTSPLPIVREVAPLPRARAPRGTAENPALPPIPPIRVTTAPVSRSTTIPPLAPPPLPPPRPSQERLVAPPRTTLPMPAMVCPPLATQSRAPEYIARELPAKIDMTDQSWFRDTGQVDSFTSAHTLGVPRRSGPLRIASKLLIPVGMLILAGVLIGGYLALDRGPIATAATPHASTALATAPAPVAPSAPAAAIAPPPQTAPSLPTTTSSVQSSAAQPASLATAVATTRPAGAPTPAVAAPSFIDVRIDSKPAGATVMLVDRGKTSQLGTTPLTAGIDPSRGYDLVFTYPNRPTHVQHINPNPASRLEVVLEKRAGASPTRPRVQARERVAHASSASASARAAGRGGNGVLMIASKPPCDIIVDGAPTGLVTPQRSLKLPAGSHTVTLVNAAQKIKKTIAVSITAGKSTKVIQDLM
ncbi:MAG: hypothetical protein AB7O24_08505 [Kofleriaceae bacterium]